MTVTAAAPDVAATGKPHGWFAPLARPTPLHHASLGTAMADLAQRVSQRWALADGPGELENDVPAVAS